MQNERNNLAGYHKKFPHNGKTLRNGLVWKLKAIVCAVTIVIKKRSLLPTELLNEN